MVEHMRSQLTLIRHGETEWNAEGRIQGLMDSPLTPKGIRQAEATAQALVESDFDVTYASPLGRARTTAEMITRDWDDDIRFDDDLKERNLGVMQGLSLPQVEARLPEVFAGFTDGAPDYVIPEGESSRQRYDRGAECLQRIAEKHRGKRILIITHGGIIDGVFRRLFAIPLDAQRHYSLYNCAMSRIEIYLDLWRLLTWGDIHHLKAIGALDDE
jgi:2,3-bisphosphoglycerate-dependent phosphoglycerate mutase